MRIISQIFVYPIKSCAGTSCSSRSLSASGLSFDRNFMLVGAADGVFLSQRTFPQLALVKADFQSPYTLVVNAPSMPEFRVKMTFLENTSRAVEVHRMSFHACDQGDSAAEWFGSYLKTACRLVAVPSENMRRREVDGFKDPVTVACQDSSPIHLVTEASLESLNAELARGDVPPLTVDRFRPNIVVSGCKAFEEDDWQKIKIGKTLFQFRKKTERCSITTVNQQTAERGSEPLKTLAQFRRQGQGVVFGTYLVPLIGENTGTVSVGQEIEVVG